MSTPPPDVAGGGAPDPGRLPLAAFDFDGTLTRADTLLPFLLRLCGRGPIAAAVVAHAPGFAAMALGRGDRDAVKAAFLARLLAGRQLAEVTAAAEVYAGRVVRRGLRGPSVDRLRWHLAEGHAVAVVSASPEQVVAPVARRLGIGVVLGTRLEVDGDGRLTGRLLGANNRGAEKVRRLEEHLAAAGHRPVQLWAYGDSAGDDELLALADHGYRVGRRGLTASRR